MKRKSTEINFILAGYYKPSLRWWTWKCFEHYVVLQKLGMALIVNYNIQKLHRRFELNLPL